MTKLSREAQAGTLSSRVHSWQAHDRKPAAIKLPARADGAPKAQAQTGTETPGPLKAASSASRSDTSDYTKRTSS